MPRQAHTILHITIEDKNFTQQVSGALFRFIQASSFDVDSFLVVNTNNILLKSKLGYIFHDVSHGDNFLIR